MDGIDPPTNGQTLMRDADLKGFALRVTANGAKALVVEKRIDGKVRRITLGRYPELTPEQARREAHKLLGKIATGVNPITERQDSRLKATTLGQAFTDYLRTTHRNLKPRTLHTMSGS